MKRSLIPTEDESVEVKLLFCFRVVNPFHSSGLKAES